MFRGVLTLVALLALLGVAACGDDDDEGEQDTRTQTTSPADEQAALRDTSTKPVIPKPSGSAPRRLVKQDIVTGTGPPAEPGDRLVVHYVGMNFSNGREIDASWDAGSPFPLQLGAGQVIPGWERGLVGIKKGGRRMVTIPPELAYGAEGFPPDIPPNETLIFVFDAVSVE